jgi:simple sugar transport system ATP-binding protein
MEPTATPAVELRGLTKRFGSVVANDHIDLKIQPGTIHGIVGENGAGKSTAMKMLYGLFPPDSGEILVAGQSRRWASPSDAIAAGIGMVHQHFMLAGPVSALDNILLGAEPTRFGIIDRGSARAKLEEIANQYHLAVDWDCPIEQLPVGIQQRVEILKLLFREARILILDEPTSVLTPQETAGLFENLRRLRSEGKTVLIITHKLNEVMALTDRVTVFRAGKVTGEMATAETTVEDLATRMVGRKVVLRIDVAPAHTREENALEIRGLSLAGLTGRRHALSNINLSVRCGEIVGVAGVEGNGQSELIQSILHPRELGRRGGGTITILGRDVTSWEAGAVRELGVGLIPEDRQLEGLLPDLSVAENFLLGLQGRSEFNSYGFLRVGIIRQTAARELDAYEVQPPRLDLAARNLSGGNQQKLIAAREFYRRPRLLIAAQPTRGVDVGGIEFLHRRIVRARDEVAGVLLISSELDEILALSDRILVLFNGRIVAEFKRGEATEAELGLKMGGS